jgi:hypothetical protein
MRRGRVKNRLYSEERKRKSIRNQERGDKTAKKHTEAYRPSKEK